MCADEVEKFRVTVPMETAADAVVGGIDISRNIQLILLHSENESSRQP